MSEIGVTAFLLVFLITMLASGVWVAFALVITGVAGMLFLSNAPIGSNFATTIWGCLLYTSPSPRDLSTSRMPSSA